MALTAQDFLNYRNQVDPSSGAYGQLTALSQNPNALPPAVVQGLITQLNPNDPNGLSQSALQSIQASTGGTYGMPTGTVANNVFGDSSVNDSGTPASQVDVTGGTNPTGSIWNQIFGSQNFDLSKVLPTVLGMGAGLWRWLGSDSAFNKAGNLVAGAEQGAGNEVMQGATNAQNAVNSAAGNAATGVNAATGNANDILGSLYNGTLASLNPYTAAGATGADLLNSGLQPGGALNSTMTADQLLANDPGYQFRLDQGLRQIQGLNAAKGLTNSGPEDKALEQYAQDYASNEFGNAFNRQQQSQQNLFGRLYGTSGLGETATGQGITGGEAFGAPQASNLINSSIYGGNAGQNAAFNSGAFGLQGAQYQGNAGVTGAGAQAGALIDANQQKNAMINQLLTSLLSLFKGGTSTIKPASGTTNSSSSGLSQLISSLLSGATA